MDYDEFSDRVGKYLKENNDWTDIEVADFIRLRTDQLIEAYKDGRSLSETANLLRSPYAQFVKALEFLVQIEPDPEELALRAAEEGIDDMDLYRALRKPHEASILDAHAAIRAYGEEIAPEGLEYMRGELYDLVQMNWTAIRQIVMVSVTNELWDGLGNWRS